MDLHVRHGEIRPTNARKTTRESLPLVQLAFSLPLKQSAQAKTLDFPAVRCSFCNKPRAQVAELARSPSAPG
jgi:hypothetical protein